MLVELTAYTERTVGLNAPPDVVARYFSQNEELLAQLVGPERVQRLEPGLYHVETRGFSALGIDVTPSFEVAFADRPGVTHMASRQCHLLHANAFEFDLSASFEGEAQFHPAPDGTELFCWTHAVARLHLPPWLSLAPRTLVKSTLEALMHGALETMSGRFVPLILEDFERWSARERATDPAL